VLVPTSFYSPPIESIGFGLSIQEKKENGERREKRKRSRAWRPSEEDELQRSAGYGDELQALLHLRLLGLNEGLAACCRLIESQAGFEDVTGAVG
jgi:hypothetical protein